MKKIICLLQLNFACLFLLAQNAITPAIMMKPVANDSVQFSARLRSLCQVAGAPSARYAYFWEFGDGTFSDAPLDANPRHRYKTSGTYQVRLLATNTYDNCPTPLLIQQNFTVQVKNTANAKGNSGFFSVKDKNSNMKVNREPKPGDPLVAYIGYRNRGGNNSSGSLILFFNDKRFLRKSFRVVDKRTYHGEESTAEPGSLNSRTGKAHAALQQLQKNYIDHTVLRFSNLQKDEENFIFFTLQMLPDMTVEIHDFITLTAMIIPDNPSLPYEKTELQMKIVPSYDPNHMIVKESRINRFRGRKKELNYKVEFQNSGAGPARNILIGIDLPGQLNAATIRIKKISPTSLLCDSVAYTQQSCLDTIISADSIHFFLKNIYLPGQQQNLVKNDDSTKGFIEYSIRLKKRPKKTPFSSRAAIVFDKNKPVYTNKATARFVGLSPGIVAGYNLSLSKENYSAKGPIQIGYVLSRYAPAGPYLQFEAHVGVLQQEDSTGQDTKADPSSYKGLLPGNYQVNESTAQTGLTTRKKGNVLQVIPLHLRINLTQWIGIGVGVMGQINLFEKATFIQRYSLKGDRFDGQFPVPFDTAVNVPVASRNNDKTFAATNFAPFFDIQIGRVRTGPVLGLRYYNLIQGNIHNRFFMYAGFKF